MITPSPGDPATTFLPALLRDLDVTRCDIVYNGTGLWLHLRKRSDDRDGPRLATCSDLSELSGMLQKPDARTMVGITAHVEKEREKKRLCLLDLSVPADDADAEEKVRAFLDRYQLSGYVLRSGRSFHFYGRDLMDPDSYERLLARFKTDRPSEMDMSWADTFKPHVLRLTTSFAKPDAPVFAFTHPSQ